uniref:Transcriptional activator protein Pur-alpha n=1 Tax=Caligus clemensi TaxID=344056 RepID=C1C1K0_CALCM|nr:Transcriptional activator protein Pur-alpha [Caligus clemensi]
MSDTEIQDGVEDGRSPKVNGSSGVEHFEKELASKMIPIQGKRFYLDVKQNQRGKFIKVAEIGNERRRSEIFLALSTAVEFRDHLINFEDFYSKLAPTNADNPPDNGKLKSEMMLKDNRKYYLDLKENMRGRYLRVSLTNSKGGRRSQIAIPVQGMVDFREALAELVEEFGVEDIPEGHHLRVDDKNFYLDIGQNTRGVYMKISEVKSSAQASITIPEKSWITFRDVFDDYVDKMKKMIESEEQGTLENKDETPSPSSECNSVQYEK